MHYAEISITAAAFKSSLIPSLLVDAGEWPLDLDFQSSLLSVGTESRLPDAETFSSYYGNHPMPPLPIDFRTTVNKY